MQKLEYFEAWKAGRRNNFLTCYLIFQRSSAVSAPHSLPSRTQFSGVHQTFTSTFLLLLKFCRDEKSYDRKNPALRVNGLAWVLWLCNNSNRKISLSGLRGFLLVWRDRDQRDKKKCIKIRISLSPAMDAGWCVICFYFSYYHINDLPELIILRWLWFINMNN